MTNTHLSHYINYMIQWVKALPDNANENVSRPTPTRVKKLQTLSQEIAMANERHYPPARMH